MSFTKFVGYAPLALLFALAACGGGNSAGGGAPVPTVPTPINTTSSGNSTTVAWHGAYAMSTDLSTSYPLLQQTATAGTWLDKRIISSDPTLGTIPPHVYKLADSIAAVGSISTETGLQYALYDIEHWTGTPLWEQQNPVAAIDQASVVAHNNGKKFGIAPDGLFMGLNPSRCTANVSSGIVPSVNWAHVDWLNIQAQALANDSNCASVANYTAFVKTVVQIARAKNPNIVITAQVSLRDSTPTRILQATSSVYGIVNGIYVAYPMTNCTNCSLTNLTAVLTGLH